METLLLISDNHLSFPLFSGGFSFFLFPFFLLSTTTRKGQQKNPPRERERFSFFFFLVGYMCVRALCFSGLAEPSVVESSDDTIESFDCYVKKHKHTHTHSGGSHLVCVRFYSSKKKIEVPVWNGSWGNCWTMTVWQLNRVTTVTATLVAQGRNETETARRRTRSFCLVSACVSTFLLSN